MPTKSLSCLLMFLFLCSPASAQADDSTKKLGAFVGKWKTEGAFTGSDNKVTSTLECRWSPQGVFLICDQAVSMAGAIHHQLTAYSYNSKDGNYSYTTVADPGARPTSGTVEIKGNIWTYTSSFENNGKTTQIRTTNEFTDPATEVFMVESSSDGGVTWKPVMQGVAHKTGS